MTIARGATVPRTKESAFCAMIINLDDPFSQTLARPFCESTHPPAPISATCYMVPKLACSEPPAGVPGEPWTPRLDVVERRV
jgi:hypothetical protein